MRVSVTIVTIPAPTGAPGWAQQGGNDVRGRQWKALAAALAVAGLVLAGCGGDDDSAGNGEASTGGQQASDVEVVTTPPEEMTVTEPLPGVPEPKSVAFVNCPVPSCQDNEPYLQDALDELGWDLTITTYDAAAPGSAFQQAIDSGVDYIATSGLPLAAIEEQVAEAEEAGIPIFEVYSTDVPAGEDNNLYSQIGGADSAVVSTDVLADWAIDDSGGSANVLFVTIRDFPILVAEEDAVTAAFEDRCGDCSVDALPVTIDDLGSGEVPQQVASYLQSNPDVDYVWFSFASLSVGVSDALDGAGLLEGRKLVGLQAEAPQVQELVDGTNAAWTAIPHPYGMWVLADQMARHATGVWSVEQEATASVLPAWVIDSPDVAEGLVPTNGWPGPDGFEDSFKTMWGLTG
jgi:ribose transport system substrate-binding protein